MAITVRQLTMRFALRAAAARKLQDGWLYLPGSEKLELDTACLLVAYPDSDEDMQTIASERGFPEEGLDTQTIEDTANAARQFQDPPSDELMLESFVYYWRFDAWLPSPDAPEPPPPELAMMNADRKFYDGLGEENMANPCRNQNCHRGAIQYSVFCRVHHFESIWKRTCPFTD